MKFLSAGHLLGIVFLLLVIGFFPITPKTYAQTPIPQSAPTPTGMVGLNAQWAFDPETTEVGKNADRSRQLLWWVLSHPPIHWSPIIAEVWSVSRNIVYVFIVVVIVAMGLGMILSRRGTIGPVFSGISSPVAGMNIVNIFFKLIMILIYVTFSYLFILGMIQLSEVMMSFVKDYVGGKDLFNVIFYGAGNSEANYTTFIGYRDINPVNQEMANTSLFLIRTTSLTYNIMSIILVLRTIILWFLLVVSPFLALLMPFIFIRNTGWIWIGVFFQWLFYGPLMILFLSTITKIWVYGIPFPFNFTRVNKPEGQIYRTAINILYGGPAQTLGPGNTANYVDTYAEYIIALIMLWTAVILPWWLLRIFRDYCCGLIASNNATLTSILDRMRQFPVPPPPSPTGPSTSAGMATELPFRQRIEERVKEYQKTRVEEYRDIYKENTVEIAKSMGMSVSSLSDISRVEMDKMKRSQINSELNKIASPERIASPVEREKYMGIRAELKARASAGDSTARTILTAGKGEAGLSSQIEIISSRTNVVTAKTASFAPSMTQVVPGQAVSSISRSNVASISKQVEMSESKVSEVLSTIQAVSAPSIPSTQVLSQKTGVTAEKVREVLDRLPSTGKIDDLQTNKIAKEVGIPVEKVKEVMTMLPALNLSPAQVVKVVAEKTGVSLEKVKEIMSVSVSAIPPDAAARKEAVKTKIANAVPVTIAGQMVQSQVSVEDYEEVKNMWLKHYREAPVPISETIKDRNEWIKSEQTRLTNISNLISSSDVKQRQKGLEQVAEILPFMLLGGFSDTEIMTYIKAKLEAAKQIDAELAIETKAKEEARVEEKKEEEENLVEVAREKKEEKKTISGEQKMEMPLEKEKEDKKQEEK